ncbi:TonB-dependent receptor plug domain-containing protein [Helicobacter sp. 23-1048]
MQKVQLDKVTATAEREFEAYQSGAQIGREMLDSNPSGNGDIGSILRILPNVQFDNAQNRSTTPGEIDPARISISGGLHYQNLFTLDGVGMNNTLNPAATANDNSWLGMGKGQSQGLAVDTSLLESITVLDSNIGASYGGFTGGVVEANTRRPTKKYGANISYQFTQGNADPKAFSLTNYHLYEGTDITSFLGSADANNQPNFHKHLIRASVESKVNDKFGIIASFSSTLSFIPLLPNAKSNYTGNYATPITRPDIESFKQTQKRQIYNYFIKGYYDVNEATRLELSYTYAPQYDYRFMYGTQGDWFNYQSGGHNLAFKAHFSNPLGMLTYTAGYQFLETSSRTNYNASKAWQISEAKNWGNYLTWAREGGQPPVESTLHTFSNKLVQDFTPFELAKMEHKFQIGLETNYQYAQSAYYKEHYYSQQQTAYKSYMTQAQQELCRQADPNQEWCDVSKVYDPRGLIKDTGTNGAVIKQTWNGRDLYIWQYGQFFQQTRHFGTKPAFVSNGIFALFAQDDIAIPLYKVGKLNARVGARGDYDTYMSKATFAPRFSLNYEAMWNEWDKGHNFATQITFGANRYYAQNLYAYALQNIQYSTMNALWRDSPDKSWQSILASGVKCSTTIKTNCIEPYGNSTKFNKLKIPYTDELMAGIAQRIFDISLGLKYIYREGKDDIRYVSSQTAKLPTDPNYRPTYYTYTNAGKSWSNIFTLSITHDTPLESGGVKHYASFNVDWTQVRRNYIDYASAISASQLEDSDILYEGRVVPYSQRPASNFVRPFTLRLNTTHSFNIGKFKWLLNNFLRYRSAYQAITRIHTAGTQYTGTRVPNAAYNPAHNDKDQYVAQTLRNAFTWDFRTGFEVDVRNGHTVYVNMDIFNLLDAKNPTILSANYAGTSSAPTIGYEVGRQFWLQVGYKF